MKKNNVKDPKITPELGADKDGMQKGGIDIQTTMPNESQTVDVKGTRRIRPEKTGKSYLVLNYVVIGD